MRKKGKNPRWERVRYWQEQLSHDDNESQNLKRHNEIWSVLEERGLAVPLDMFAGYGPGAEPLRVMFQFFDEGLPIPPELMVTIREAFDNYLAGRGQVSLEEVFFGKPSRNAGNYAQRNFTKTTGHRRHVREFAYLMSLFTPRRGGVTRSAIAKRFIQDRGLTMEPEVLLAEARRLKDEFPPKLS